MWEHLYNSVCDVKIVYVKIFLIVWKAFLCPVYSHYDIIMVIFKHKCTICAAWFVYMSNLYGGEKADGTEQQVQQLRWGQGEDVL